MRRRHFTLLTLLLLASMATAPAYAQTPAAHDYLLAHLCASYTAAQNGELPKVLHLRAAQRATRQPRPATPRSTFVAPAFVTAPLRPGFFPAATPSRASGGPPQLSLLAARPSRANPPPASL